MPCPTPYWLKCTIPSIFFCAAVHAAAASLDVQSVVDLARSAPPEVAADALLRLATVDHVAKDLRVQLLEQSFALAAGAPQPYKRRSGLETPKGPSGYLTRVYQQDLDVQSLRIRGVDGMLLADASKARDLFEQMPPLDLPPLSCDDYTVYDVDGFYDLLDRVAAQTFSVKEVRQGDRAHFLARYISNIHSAVEVAPVARLLGAAPVDDAEFQQIVTSFASALSRISGDDRSFTDGARRAGPAILALVPISQRRGISPLVILEAYRLFLVNNLSAPRCSETKTEDSAESPATFFNDHLALGPLQPLTSQEIAPAKVEGEAKGLDWCDTAECKDIRRQFLSLVRRDDGEAYQPAQKQQSEWQAKVRDFLNALTDWTGSAGEAPVDHFRERVEFYNQLLALVPNGDTREFVLHSFLAFLVESRLPPEDRIEWLFAASELVERVNTDSTLRDHMAADLRRANDPVISLYMSLESIAPMPAEKAIQRL